MNTWYNKINDYKNPISFSDIYLDKYNRIHNDLMSYALDFYVNREYVNCNAYISSYNSYISSYNISSNSSLSYVSYITANEYKNSYRWIEKSDINKNYWEPSYLFRISRYPQKINSVNRFSKTLIDLQPYWKNEYTIAKRNSYFNDNMFLFNDDEPHIYEVDYIDYMKEKIRINDKLTEQKIWMKFNTLKTDIQKNQDLLKY